MNKTPIQELIDYCVNNKRHHHCDSIHNPIEYLEYKDLIGKLSRCQQKEKQFGFDCFEAGRSKSYGEPDWSDFDGYYFCKFSKQQKQ